MRPTPDQIRTAAYHRWQRRGGLHGHHLDDWDAAEQDLLFTLNYRVIVPDSSEAVGDRVIGDPRRPVCRFCEQAAPRATFSGPARSIPESLGVPSPLLYDECEECRTLFRDGIDRDFTAFTQLLGAQGCLSRRWPPASLAVFKFLTKTALAIMPDEELDFFHDAIEWVCNPDHEFDGSTFGGLGGFLHQNPDPSGASWVALARRIDDEVGVPYMLVFVGMPAVTFEFPVPLSTRDEDHDDLVIPRVASPFGLTEGRDPASCLFVPMSRGAGAVSRVP